MNPLYKPGSQICAEVRQACFLDKYNGDSIDGFHSAVNSFLIPWIFSTLEICLGIVCHVRVYTKRLKNTKGAVPPHSLFCFTALLSFSGLQSLQAGVRVPRPVSRPQRQSHRSSVDGAPWSGRFRSARNAFCFPRGSLRD